MWVLNVIIMSLLQNTFQHQLNLRNIGQDEYCLLYYALDSIYDNIKNVVDDKDDMIVEGGSFTPAHQFISYCLQSSEDIHLATQFNNTFDLYYTFAELQEKNISSNQLLLWLTSIDTAERYQIFLSNSLSKETKSEILHYFNCTAPWFGPLCQFKFQNLLNKSLETNHSVRTCYKHRSCRTLKPCLDWRDICDRKVDCLDGSDEINCWQLEVNECAQDEYRCYDGQCIPRQFFADGPMNPDCLDRTDERTHSIYPDQCRQDPTFRCEEHTCRPRLFELSCGDGSCSREFGFLCQDDRDKLYDLDLCSRSIACFMRLHSSSGQQWCRDVGEKQDFIEKHCQSLHEFSSRPILFGHVRFIYNITAFEYKKARVLAPDYICYNETLCKDFLPTTTSVNNLTCRRFNELNLKDINKYFTFMDLTADIKNLFRKCLILIVDTTSNCNHSKTMYQCRNSSKCISKHRLLDGIVDCPFDDDEIRDNNYHRLNKTDHYFTCSMPLTKRSQINVCQNAIDDRSISDELLDDRIYFPSICDDRIDTLPFLIDGRNETDETDCEIDIWPCNNTYTRCDHVWHCENGADEINCSPYSNCSNREHQCVFANDTSKISCLPIADAGNGIVDCLGATDERNSNRETDRYRTLHYFRCRNSTKLIDRSQFCDNRAHCQSYADDELFCENEELSGDICDDFDGITSLTDVQKYFCDFTSTIIIPKIKYFQLHDIVLYPSSFITSTVQSINRTNEFSQTKSIEPVIDGYCHRGISISLRINMNTSKLACLCPPSYYGDRCQYQSDRVSLTVQIRTTSDWHTPLVFLLTLIDNQMNIQSHDRIEYLSIRDCQIKFNVYLLYSFRLKNLSKEYFVKIDVFNHLTLDYRTSWLFPIRFIFLPVYRLSVLLTVPFLNSKSDQICQMPCIHGQCYSYINNSTATFCHCYPGWSGAQCNIKYDCSCAAESVCISNSICICPLGRFGQHCFLQQSSCDSTAAICENGGRCIPTDERYPELISTKSQCFCTEGYFGDRCQYKQKTRIDISFHQSISIPTSLIIHLITIHTKSEPTRITLMEKIAFDQNQITFYTSIGFNIAFVQMSNYYYLVILQKETIISAVIATEILPSHQCLSITELFNESVTDLHLIKRIKLYHMPCPDRPELACFYDSNHMCLCNRARQANCFDFDHHMAHDCRGHNLCENDGQCFQDNFTCPTLSTCVCQDCYYGSRCQFSTKGSTLSLDAILGYAIRPLTRITQQSLAVKMSICITTIIFTIGFLSNLCSLLTFQSKTTHNVGCGQYLLMSSIVSILTLSILSIKFCILLAWQIGSIKNQNFLFIQCILIDYFLRVLVSTGDWLNACVAIERVVNIIQGIKFNKQKSIKYARWIILLVFMLTFVSHLYDPIHRQIIHDEEDQRTWCVTDYSSNLKQIDQILNVIHFCLPVFINLIAAIIIILASVRKRSNAQKNVSYKKILRQQLEHHKHLLISPLILVLLALPRLIISFLFGCMKSARNPWFYLIGYYMSFVPSMLTFIVFVLPSQAYKKEFKKSIVHIWKRT